MIKKIKICVPIMTLIMALSVMTAHASANNKEKAQSLLPHHAVIAHRGASYWAPEETSPAYLLSCELGADYLEFDIQLTSDGVPVLFHDDTLERTTNVAELFPQRKSKPVNAFTLEEIKKLDAGSWYNKKYPERARPSYSGQKILSLEDFIKTLALCKPGQRLYIESKSPEANPGVEQKIVSALKIAGLLDKSNVVFQSFDIGSLKRFKELAPEIPRVYLISEEMEKESGMDKLISDISGVCSGIGPVGYVAWPWNIKKAHKAGLQVHVYTINAKWQAKLVNCFGADGMFTDRCDMLLEMYKRGPGVKPEEILKRLGY